MWYSCCFSSTSRSCCMQSWYGNGKANLSKNYSRVCLHLRKDSLCDCLLKNEYDKINRYTASTMKVNKRSIAVLFLSLNFINVYCYLESSRRNQKVYHWGEKTLSLASDSKITNLNHKYCSPRPIKEWVEIPSIPEQDQISEKVVSRPRPDSVLQHYLPLYHFFDNLYKEKLLTRAMHI